MYSRIGTKLERITLSEVTTPCANDVTSKPGLRLLREIDVKRYVHGIAVHPGRKEVVVRCNDERRGVKVYSYEGKPRAQYDVITRGETGGVAVDTKRDYYLLPMDNYLTILTDEGKIVSNVSMSKCQLRGVTYLSDADLYVISNERSDCIYVLNAADKKVIRTFGSTGDRGGQFYKPLHLSSLVGKSSPVIVVSDSYNHRIQLININGTCLYTYGRYGNGDAEVVYVNDVCVDASGRIVACDDGNRRLVTYWTEEGLARWRCLIPEESLGGAPGHVDIDVQEKVLVVEVDKIIKIYTYA